MSLPEPWAEMDAAERKALLHRTVTAALSSQNVSPKTITIITRSFQDDAAVLAKFHQEVFGDDAGRYPLWRADGSPSAGLEIQALMRFPSNLGGAVDHPRTVEWASDILNRFLATRTPVAGGGFYWYADRMHRVAKKLFKSGVPIGYFNSFHPASIGRVEYPVKEVIEAYRNGIAAEYLHVMLGAD